MTDLIQTTVFLVYQTANLKSFLHYLLLHQHQAGWRRHKTIQCWRWRSEWHICQTLPTQIPSLRLILDSLSLTRLPWYRSQRVLYDWRCWAATASGSLSRSQLPAPYDKNHESLIRYMLRAIYSDECCPIGREPLTIGSFSLMPMEPRICRMDIMVDDFVWVRDAVFKTVGGCVVSEWRDIWINRSFFGSIRT